MIYTITLNTFINILSVIFVVIGYFLFTNFLLKERKENFKKSIKYLAVFIIFGLTTFIQHQNLQIIHISKQPLNLETYHSKSFERFYGSINNKALFDDCLSNQNYIQMNEVIDCYVGNIRNNGIVINNHFEITTFKR